MWINGPPGAGKTTLVNSYLEKKKIPCLWYQVDSGDTDAATFFHYLSLANSSQQKTGKRKDLPHFTAEYQGGLSTFTRNFFHELFKQIPPHSAIVFDNFQEAAMFISPPHIEMPGGGQGEGGQRRFSYSQRDMKNNPLSPPLSKGGDRITQNPPLVVKGGRGGLFSGDSGNSTFIEIINTAIQEIPTDCSIIFISRTPRPPSLQDIVLTVN